MLPLSKSGSVGLLKARLYVGKKSATVTSHSFSVASPSGETFRYVKS